LIAVLLLARLRGAAITHYIVYYVPALSGMRRDGSKYLILTGDVGPPVLGDSGERRMCFHTHWEGCQGRDRQAVSNPECLALDLSCTLLLEELLGDAQF
jgi:hypothetical protein